MLSRLGKMRKESGTSKLGLSRKTPKARSRSRSLTASLMLISAKLLLRLPTSRFSESRQALELSLEKTSSIALEEGKENEHTLHDHLQERRQVCRCFLRPRRLLAWRRRRIDEELQQHEQSYEARQ